MTAPRNHEPTLAERLDSIRKAADSDIGLSDALEELARLEERAGNSRDAIHHRNESAKVGERAKALIDELRAELLEQERALGRARTNENLKPPPSSEGPR